MRMLQTYWKLHKDKYKSIQVSQWLSGENALDNMFFWNFVKGGKVEYSTFQKILKSFLIKGNDCVMQITTMNIKPTMWSITNEQALFCKCNGMWFNFSLILCAFIMFTFSQLCQRVWVHWCALQPRSNNAGPPRCQHSSWILAPYAPGD